MLFRALLDRLLGTNDSYIDDDMPPQTRTSLAKLPGLTDIILRLLSAPVSTDSSDSAITEGVFPALQLLQRAPAPASRLHEVQNAVFHLLSSPHWHVRDKAARTYAMLVLPESQLVTFAKLMEATVEHQNALHGALLSSRYLANRIIVNNQCHVSEVAMVVQEAGERLYNMNTCPFTQAAYIDVHRTLARAALYGSTGDPLQTSFSGIMELKACLSLPRDGWPATSLLRRSLACLAVFESATHTIEQSDLIALAIDDPDACEIALEEAYSLITSTIEFRKRSARALTDISHSLLLVPRVASSVHDAARRVLVAVLDLPLASAEDGVLFDGQLVKDTSSTSTSLLSSDTALVLVGGLLDVHISTRNSIESVLLRHFAEWVKSLEAAVQEDNVRMIRPFGIRTLLTAIAF